MNVSFEGIGYQAVTLPNNTGVAGQLCRLNLLGSTEKCNEGDSFCGFLEAVEGDYAAVQIEGFVDVKYTGSPPPTGYIKLSCNGSGGVKMDTAGREYLVVETKNAESKVTLKL